MRRSEFLKVLLAWPLALLGVKALETAEDRHDAAVARQRIAEIERDPDQVVKLEEQWPGYDGHTYSATATATRGPDGVWHKTTWTVDDAPATIATYTESDLGTATYVPHKPIPGRKITWQT